MKRVVTIVVALLMLVAVPATVFLVMRNQELRKRAAPATTMTISPATASKQVGEEFTLDINMNTAENQVVAVQVSLAFDPEKLEAVWIHNGTMFPNIISSGVVGSGVASIALGAANTTTPITGTGQVATIRLKALAATTSPVAVRFAADSFAGALGEGSVNVLTSTTPSTITIGGSSTGSTPTPTPTGSSSNGTPTPTPTGSSSNGTPTPTPTGTTGSGTPTPTRSAASGTATPTPTGSQSASGAVSITSPVVNSTVTTQTPTFRGVAPPGSLVTIAVYSNQQITATVTADANGNWSYTVADPLEAGSHTIVVAAQNPTTGQTETATIAFSVSDGDLAGDEMPVSGNAETTILLLGIGLLLLVSGSLIPVMYRRNV